MRQWNRRLWIQLFQPAIDECGAGGFVETRHARNERVRPLKATLFAGAKNFPLLPKKHFLGCADALVVS